MNIEVHTPEVSLTHALKNRIERSLSFALDHAEDKIRKVMVSLRDLNGPKGGRDKNCRLVVHIPSAHPVVVEEKGNDLYAAIDRAAERAGFTIDRLMQKKHRKWLHDRRAARAGRWNRHLKVA